VCICAHVIFSIDMVWQYCGGFDRIFSDKIVDQVEIFDRIKLISWKQLSANKISLPYLFYEWCVDPFNCLARKL
jgi:hypothetical protein